MSCTAGCPHCVREWGKAMGTGSSMEEASVEKRVFVFHKTGIEISSMCVWLIVAQQEVNSTGKKPAKEL